MEWQPIATAPKDGTRIDIWIAPLGGQGVGHRIPDAYWNDSPYYKGAWVAPGQDDDGGEDVATDTNWPATHWMPIPEPPNAP